MTTTTEERPRQTAGSDFAELGRSSWWTLAVAAFLAVVFGQVAPVAPTSAQVCRVWTREAARGKGFLTRYQAFSASCGSPCSACR